MNPKFAYAIVVVLTIMALISLICACTYAGAKGLFSLEVFLLSGVCATIVLVNMNDKPGEI